MSTDEMEYRDEVKRSLKCAIASGYSDFEDIVVAVGSPDPRLVKELYDELASEGETSYDTAVSTETQRRVAHARRLSANLALELPAADPMRSQWWFTLDSVVALAERVVSLSSNGRVAFLGTPTVGFHYSHSFNSSTTIMDADPDLIRCLTLPETATKLTYDVADDIPSDLQRMHSIVLIDPPWYPDHTEHFIARARDLIDDNGFILCILPSRLTRPGLIPERTDLISKLLAGNFELVSLESSYVNYRVPEFEIQAYQRIEGFTGRQWRQGDLLILRVSAASAFSASRALKREEILSFARKPQRLRFFLAPERVTEALEGFLQPVAEFGSTVSTRNISLETVGIWGTNKKGASIKDANLAQLVLESWASGETPEEVGGKLIEQGFDEADRIVEQFREHLGLWWDVPSKPERRRDPSKLAELHSGYLSDLAAQPSARKYDFKSDGFRLDFQRDRDRILWSHALRRLANKTQVFPVQSDDHLRRRLSHSIEVMQLASTIASSFGLDRDLTEAGALVHDIGHAPFGHAGEHALNNILNEIDERFGGFNHYEHGVDVVRWIEDVYQSPGAGEFPGLNLTKETTECIIKHAYWRNDEPMGQSALIKASKHSDLEDSSCHLEGQSIRIADKISYLISDLEDGIRMGVFTYENIMTCRFFERPPIDMCPSTGESLYDRFISQRRAILKVIMEDILTATDQRLGRVSSLEDVRATREYIVSYSQPLNEEISQIWKRLQAGILHKAPSVVTENMRCARIVCDLLFVCAVSPQVVDPTFRRSHEKLARTEYMEWYLSMVGKEIGLPQRLLSRYSYEHAIGTRLQRQGDNWLIPTEDLVLAKDYVASLTDRCALLEHRKHCSGLL